MNKKKKKEIKEKIDFLEGTLKIRELILEDFLTDFFKCEKKKCNRKIYCNKKIYNKNFDIDYFQEKLEVKYMSSITYEKIFNRTIFFIIINFVKLLKKHMNFCCAE